MAERVNIVINGAAPVTGSMSGGDSVHLRYFTEDGEYLVTAAANALTVRFKGETAYELYLDGGGASRLTLTLCGAGKTTAAVELISYALKRESNGVFISADYSLEGENRTIVMLITREDTLA